MSAGPWPTSVPGTRFTDVRHLAEVDSTNRLVLDEAAAGAPEGLVVVADVQTAGRGRLGRRWEAPAGANLLVTILLRPGLPWTAAHRCTSAVALAAADACRAVAGIDVATKWPNDLVVPDADGGLDRKLAGILAETTGPATGGAVAQVSGQAVGGAVARRRPAAADGPAAVAVGLGLNVGWAPPDPVVPPWSAPGAPRGGGSPTPATSLEHQAGRPVDRRAVLWDLLQRLDARLADLASTDGQDRLDDEHRRSCRTLGQRVVVHLPDQRVEGTATAITGRGALVVALAGGGRLEVTAGDVVHVRPAG